MRIMTLQELPEHSSVKVTERYTHPNKARKYEAVNRTGFNPSKTYKICVGLKPDLFF